MNFKPILTTLTAGATLLMLGACGSTSGLQVSPVKPLALSSSLLGSLPSPGDFKTKQPSQTFVGRVEKTDWMIGVVVGEKEFAAFVSDGQKKGEWLGGYLENGLIVAKSATTRLEAKLGTTLSGTVSLQGGTISGSINLEAAESGRTGLFRSVQVFKDALQERGVIVGRYGIRGATVRSTSSETQSGAGTSADHEPLDPGSGVAETPVVDDMKRYPPDAPNPKEYLDGHGSATEVACAYYSDLEHYLEAKIYQIELELSSVSVLDSSEEQRQDRELLDFLNDRLLNAQDQVDYACFGISHK